MSIQSTEGHVKERNQRGDVNTIRCGGYFWDDLSGCDMVFQMNVCICPKYSCSALLIHPRYLHRIGAPAHQVQAAFSSRECGCCVPG